MIAKKQVPEKATQKTAKGLEIPIPKRDAFMDNIKKASDAKPSRPRRRRKKD